MMLRKHTLASFTLLLERGRHAVDDIAYPHLITAPAAAAAAAARGRLHGPAPACDTGGMSLLVRSKFVAHVQVERVHPGNAPLGQNPNKQGASPIDTCSARAEAGSPARPRG